MIERFIFGIDAGRRGDWGDFCLDCYDKHCILIQVDVNCLNATADRAD
jgi:hypothetical protein